MDNNSTSQINIQIHHLKQQLDSISKADSTAGNSSNKLCLVLFYLQLILLPILTTYLTIRGIISAALAHNKNLFLHLYLPLLTSTAVAALVAFLFQVATRMKPSTTFRATFWGSPLLMCAVGFLFLANGTAGSFVAALLIQLAAVIQSLYGCWVVPRMDYAIHILSISLSTPTYKATNFLAVCLLVGTFFSCLVSSGLGGVTQTHAQLAPLFIFVILVSLLWTMHVIRNTFQVAISRPVYVHFSRATEADVPVGFIRDSMGSVCLGSILVPVIGIFRGFSRVMTSIAGGTDEFMFSCASCYASVADRVIAYGNRWGFVQVGAGGKGFVRASIDTWQLFEQRGMKSLIDTDLTGAFCFFCGVAGGSVCGLVSGSWVLAVEKDYAIQVTIYASLIGYFMVRISMAWPQACVAGYYVAFAEYSESLRFDSAILRRIQELRRSSRE